MQTFENTTTEPNFKVPQSDIDSIRSKFDLKIFHEYANILKGMYSARFNGDLESKGDHNQMDTVPGGPSPPSSRLSKLDIQIKSGASRQKRRRVLASINTLYYI